MPNKDLVSSKPPCRLTSLISVFHEHTSGCGILSNTALASAKLPCLP
jgi:hypothetical protein